MLKSKLLSLSALSLAVLTSANAALTVTNGTFETGGGNNIDNVNGWFDPSNGTFWQGTWQTNAAAITPNGTNVIVLGSYESGAIRSTTSASPLIGNYLYQSIGTAGVGQTALQVNFDFGAPNDDPGGRTLGLTVAVFAYNGLGGFTAADNTAINGASGITLLDSQSVTVTSTGVDGLVSSFLRTLNISGAGSQELFLSFNNYRPANTESWSVIDNVSITAVPEPSTYALFAGAVTLLAVGIRRRSRKG